MTKEEIIKLFDERFKGCYINKGDGGYVCDIYIKQFIFETIIPEVLKNIIEEYGDYNDGCGCCSNTILETEIKQKAKQNFNIDL